VVRVESMDLESLSVGRGRAHNLAQKHLRSSIGCGTTEGGQQLVGFHEVAEAEVDDHNIIGRVQHHVLQLLGYS